MTTHFAACWYFTMGALRAIIGILSVFGCRETHSFVPVGPNVARSATGMNRRSWATPRSGVMPLAASPSDGLGETKRVGFVTSGTAGENEGEEEEGSGEEERVVPQTVNQRLLAQIAAQGKDIVIPTEESKTIIRREEDLNGVNPLYAILGAGGAAAMSFGSWKATLWFAQAYYSKPPQESDILAVARMTSFIKQAVVGLFALGSGIFGVTALGMGIMAGIVAVGVAKGELDPSPEASTSKTPAPGASEEEVDRIMLEKAEESLRKAQADIDRDISGKS